MRRYKLVCILLHDPDDKKFVNHIRRRFVSLDEATGKDMLFITFMEPPKQWQENDGFDVAEREMHNLCAEPHFDDWLVINHFLPKATPESEELPCMIVTDDLLSRRYVLLKSSIDSVDSQLVAIGRYCSEREGRFPVSDPAFMQFAATLGSCHLENLAQRSLAEEILETLTLNEEYNEGRFSFVPQPSSSSSEDRDRGHAVGPPSPSGQRIHARRATVHRPGRQITTMEPTLYKKLLINVNDIRGYESCNVRSRGNIIRYCNSLSGYIPKKRRFSDAFEPPLELLYEDREKTILKSYNSLALPLALFFEAEMNYTLVQLMRRHFGIDMPEYYMKFMEGKEATVQTGKIDSPQPVRLNSSDEKGRLKQVLIGSGYYAYITMCNPRRGYGMQDVIGGSFTNDWRNLLHLRNDVCHASIYEDEFFGYKEFLIFFNSFKSILQDSLWKMEKIKEILLTGGDEEELRATV